MNQLIFVISILSIISILIASALSLTRKEIEFFPPPNKKSWQYLLFWSLFRVMFIGLTFLSVSSFNSAPFVNAWFRYLAWLPIMLLGFGSATYLSMKLGWENAHGEAKGLVISGWYRWSRNPIYVVSLIGMLGWGLFINSFYVYILLVLWALMYIIAPYIEEPWLEEKYGGEYLAYKSQVPRFLAYPKEVDKFFDRMT